MGHKKKKKDEQEKTMCMIQQLCSLDLYWKNACV